MNIRSTCTISAHNPPVLVMQALTCVNWWQKSGIFLPISIVLRIRHLGEGTINDVMMMRWCHDNDVMIAATLHWLLLAMWHVNHSINSHVIGKSENQYLPKKTRDTFLLMKWSISNVWTDSSYELPISKVESMHG